jgi:hypothetical protein
MSAEQTAERTRRPRSPNKERQFLIVAWNEDDTVTSLGVLTAPGGTRRYPMKGRQPDGTSAVELAGQEWPEEFDGDERPVLSAIRLSDPEKDLEKHAVGKQTVTRFVVD